MGKAYEAASVAVNIGVGIIECGGEVSRAEDSAKRVAFALGMKSCEVFALNSFIMLTVESEDKETATLSRTVKGDGTDLMRLERINALSRRICNERLSADIAQKEFEDIKPLKLSLLVTHTAAMTVCAIFTLYFGGGLREAFVSAVAANITVLMKENVKSKFGNAVIFTFICSLFCGLCGVLLVRLGFASNYDLIAMGDIMLLIPGVTLICAGRDMICGDLLTGGSELVEAVLTAFALTLGFVIPKLILI